ncbi:expressed unknown protein [Seminavis robusta]|uniref:Methyltransferase domain-containing protein n=1 Tax=Seminavis robusta TaxID=568900 RepID=A0A9N8DTT0_9STRA|nr:expressed unknown protein [Seminavis robusta]|eukprot:Sro337_g120610.1 n/a (349) ;mRNA; f:32931-33977
MKISTTRDSSGNNDKSRILLAIVGLVFFLVGRFSERSSRGVVILEQSQAQPKQAQAQPRDRCSTKLQELEDQWNARRQARQSYTLGQDAQPLRHKQIKTDSNGAFDYFEPEAVCFDDERFGTSNSHATDFERYQGAFGDGPKFLCGVDRIIQQNGGCLIYTVGTNKNQIEFEKTASLNLKCEIHTFDPTISTQQYKGNDYSKFHEWGLGEEDPEKKQISLETVVQKLGHQNRTVDILKMDCEGCEYQVLKDAFQAMINGKLRINQVLVQFHATGMKRKKNPNADDRIYIVDTPQDFANMKALFQVADQANMRVFHKERNGWTCGGYACIEYAFASNEFLRRANSHYIC